MLLRSVTVSEQQGTRMQNLPIPASALPPQVNAAPVTLDTAPASGPDTEAFGAVLARELTAALSGAALSDGQPQPPGSEMMTLQIPAEPGPMAPALLALIPGMPPDQYATGDQQVIPLKTPGQRMVGLATSGLASGDQPINPSITLGPRMVGFAASDLASGDQPINASITPGQHLVGLSASDRASGDQPPIPAKALPAALSTETSAQHSFPQTALTASPALDSDNTADFAAPGKIPPLVVAEERTSRSGTEPQAPLRLSEPASLLQMTNLAIATATPPAYASAPAAQNLKLDIPVGAPGWNGELAQKVVWMATQQQQVAELRLNPPHLGPVEVKLTVGNDQGTQAGIQFASPHLATREAIESALPRLREMMADSGIALGDVTVGADSFQQQAEAGRQDRLLTKQPADIGTTATRVAGRSAVTYIRGERNGLVDTFA
ncbi:MAG: flagellar hook-length control protein FliK [Betaproteobacteria bacterium]|nr:flagellar hook-length control protein FliK [Betaproteobacteria bacterium]